MVVKEKNMRMPDQPGKLPENKKTATRRPPLGLSTQLSLFDCDRFGQVSRLVDRTTPHHGHVVGHKLERDHR